MPPPPDFPACVVVVTGVVAVVTGGRTRDVIALTAARAPAKPPLPAAAARTPARRLPATLIDEICTLVGSATTNVPASFRRARRRGAAVAPGASGGGAARIATRTMFPLERAALIAFVIAAFCAGVTFAAGSSYCAEVRRCAVIVASVGLAACAPGASTSMAAAMTATERERPDMGEGYAVLRTIPARSPIRGEDSARRTCVLAAHIL